MLILIVFPSLKICLSDKGCPIVLLFILVFQVNVEETVKTVNSRII